MRRRELEQMHNEMKALRTALGVYADPANWSLNGGKWVPNESINPNTAREALEMYLLDASNHSKAKKASEAVKMDEKQWKKPD